MHTSITLKQWFDHVHDGRVKAAHYAGHLLHTKSFWGILAILALIIGMLAALILFGVNTPLRNYTIPYAPYY